MSIIWIIKGLINELPAPVKVTVFELGALPCAAAGGALGVAGACVPHPASANASTPAKIPVAILLFPKITMYFLLEFFIAYYCWVLFDYIISMLILNVLYVKGRLNFNRSQLITVTQNMHIESLL
ncbi:fragment of N-acetylmuramic acid 6-phosphate etherase [Candidatus Desulfosporosinus infrequens]|uniref:Fragment of N-acetylmuramic acid 6-phosphate etherase n=1 Tax=Candidatus Desulfosporosinus infrequens TaxID=2043169 RepID=A0A2U3LAB1_9FIRM|nr:fragment of N-acetylmuramic acid 6-phosphate etherase [Candidatus Desulfosporosinus infrequens]